MFLLLAIALVLLPFLIACVRNIGLFASAIVAVCTVAVIVLALAGLWEIAAAPWLLALVASVASIGARERRQKQQHAELLKAIAAKDTAPAKPADVVDRFIASGD